MPSELAAGSVSSGLSGEARQEAGIAEEAVRCAPDRAGSFELAEGQVHLRTACAEKLRELGLREADLHRDALAGNRRGGAPQGGKKGTGGAGLGRVKGGA